jgi:hypothetical protein
MDLCVVSVHPKPDLNAMIIDKLLRDPHQLGCRNHPHMPSLKCFVAESNVGSILSGFPGLIL